MKNNIWGLLRIALGFVFFWAFIDKLFGLGFATAAGKSWLSGGSPTTGFLKMGTQGPFASFFQSLAGSAVVDWLFMMGLLLLGVSLILGIGVKIASYGGSLLLFLMWLALIPPQNNPFVDEHIIYILALLGLGSIPAADREFSLAKWWLKTKLVKKNPILQ